MFFDEGLLGISSRGSGFFELIPRIQSAAARSATARGVGLGTNAKNLVPRGEITKSPAIEEYTFAYPRKTVTSNDLACHPGDSAYNPARRCV